MKTPRLIAFTLPAFTHRLTVSCDTPRAFANCFVVNSFFISSILSQLTHIVNVQTFYFLRGIVALAIYFRASWGFLWSQFQANTQKDILFTSITSFLHCSSSRIHHAAIHHSNNAGFVRSSTGHFRQAESKYQPASDRISPVE